MVRKAFNWIGNLILASSFALLLLVLVAPYQFDLSFHKVIGTSMEPSIRLGEVVALRQVDPRTVDVGMVIGFRAPGVDTPVVHRVVRIVLDEEGRRVGFNTKGDNVEDEDPWVVAPEDVLGVVVFHIPFVGFWEELLRTPIGFGLFILLPGIGVIVLQVKDMLEPAPRVPRRRMERPSRTRWDLVYLLVGLLVVMFVGFQASGRVQVRALTSFAPDSEQGDGKSVLSVTRNFRNDGPVPLLLAIVPQEPGLSAVPSFVWLSPGQTERVHLQGPPDGMVAVVGFLPILPSEVLAGLARWNPRLAPLVATWLVASPFLLLGAWLQSEARSVDWNQRLRLRSRYG